MDIGARITVLRNQRGIRLVALASAAGLAHSHLSDIEKGKKLPSITKLRAICDALGITLADFFAPTGEGVETLPPELRRFLDNARDLSPEQLAALEHVIRAFKE